MSCIAGLDFGTSSVKLVVLTPEGELVASAQAEYDTLRGPAGEVEQRPEDWWSAACGVLATSGVAHLIDGIGLTGQMQDVVPVGGGAQRNALLYSDTRAEAQHERLRSQFPDWEERTGNHQDLTNVAAKTAWLAENEPQTIGAADHLLLSAHGYIAWRATGSAACDVVTASTSGLLDIEHRDWLRAVVEAAGARIDQMPTLVGQTAGDDIVGAVSPTAARELGVRTGIPVVLAMGDAGSTTDGLVGSAPGDAYLYLGTTGWFAGVTPAAGAEVSPIHSLVMPGWETRLRIGAVQSAGSAAAWARDTFFAGLDFAQIERRIAPRVGDLSARPLCLPGFAGERTPVRDSSFRGAFVGMREATEPADLHLAVLTGVAMGLRHAADEMGIRQDRIPLVGGAATSPAWRRILADVFDATIVSRSSSDPGARSAARAAADALGVPHTLHPVFTPEADEADSDAIVTDPATDRARYEPLIAAHRALYDALAPTFHRLTDEPLPR